MCIRDSYYPELLETPVPRYTSFPTAAEFSDAVGRGDLEQRLDRVSGDISLYVHIPFCESICWYCGCNTGAANRRDRLAGYLDSLAREIALVMGLFGLVAFIWALQRGQFEDLDGAANRILIDDEGPDTP